MRRTYFAVVVFAACRCIAAEWELVPVGSSVHATPGQSAIPRFYRGETDTNAVDVLFVFDASSQPFLRSRGVDCSAYAELCVEDLNRSLGYTGIDRHFRFRLAGVLDLSPVDLGEYELGDIVAAFAPSLAAHRLAAPTADRVRAERDDRRADVVVFLPAGRNPTVYGYSPRFTREDMTGDGLGKAAERAFCACRIDSVGTRHTVLHEIGHLLGAGHSDMQKKSPGPQMFAYSSAYRFHADATPLTTAVGYPEEKDGTILPFLSSPDYALTWRPDVGEAVVGIPVGTPTNDNTRTVIATFPVVAQYRVAKPDESAARFDHGLTFSLHDGEKTIAAGGGISLRCGVRSSLAISGVADGVSIRASGLPRGLGFDGEKRTLSGLPVERGLHTAFFSFTDAATGAFARRRLTFNVEPLPEWALGDFASEGGLLRINVSSRGGVRVTARKAMKSDKTSLRGFVREERDGSGVPVFVLEDGKRLSSETVGWSRRGMISCPDGTVCHPATKKPRRAARIRRREKSNSKQPTPQTKKESKP